VTNSNNTPNVEIIPPQGASRHRMTEMVFAYYNFSAPVYSDADLTTPFPTNVVRSDADGAFPIIHLDPQVIYRVQLYNSAHALIVDKQVDPKVEVHCGPFSVVP
jgi:hypothetical protein